MQKVGSLVDAEEELLREIKELLARARAVVPEEVRSFQSGIDVLGSLRDLVYEALNQIQHAALLLEAARWLRTNVLGGKEPEWHWNPRQTGGIDEPDLRCDHDLGRIVAEATTSARAEGSIDVRMASTLSKLNKMKGDRFYFVRTGHMKRRAETKIKKGGWQIQVVELSENLTFT